MTRAHNIAINNEMLLFCTLRDSIYNCYKYINRELIPFSQWIGIDILFLTHD